MYGFSLLDIAALVFFLVSWLGYHMLVEALPFGKLSLNLRMNYRRARWIEQAIRRENRIFDASLALEKAIGFDGSKAYA